MFGIIFEFVFDMFIFYDLIRVESFLFVLEVIRKMNFLMVDFIFVLMDIMEYEFEVVLSFCNGIIIFYI